MKAKARILILLICMVSITGFGYSTPDLIQNSEVVTLSTYDVGLDNVIALNVETKTQDFIKEQITLKAMSYVDLSITKDEELKSSINSIRTLLNEKIKPPLNRNSKGFYNYNLQERENHKDVFIYRRAREGLSS